MRIWVLSASEETFDSRGISIVENTLRVGAKSEPDTPLAGYFEYTVY